jgi:hypothetical protein
LAFSTVDFSGILGPFVVQRYGACLPHPLDSSPALTEPRYGSEFKGIQAYNEALAHPARLP